jgi:hypothetical protein
MRTNKWLKELVAVLGPLQKSLPPDEGAASPEGLRPRPAQDAEAAGKTLAAEAHARR